MALQSLKDIRLCFVGDSFVNGTGDPDGLGWAGRLCTQLSKTLQNVEGNSLGEDSDRTIPITYYNLGIRRETSHDIALRWEAEVTRRFNTAADCRIIFSFGTNDTTLENGVLRVIPDTSLHNARAILTQAQQRFPVLMIGPPPIEDAEQNQRIEALSQQFAQLCQELGIPYLEVFSALIASEVWMAEVARVDGAHPQAKGYALLAELIQQWTVWQHWFEP